MRAAASAVPPTKIMLSDVSARVRFIRPSYVESKLHEKSTLPLEMASCNYTKYIAPVFFVAAAQISLQMQRSAICRQDIQPFLAHQKHCRYTQLRLPLRPQPLGL